MDGTQVVISLNENSFSSVEELWVELEQLQKVESIVLQNAGLNGQRCRKLASNSQGKWDQLHTIIIRDSKVGPRGVRVLAEDIWSKCKAIRILNIGNCKMGHFGAQAFAEHTPTTLTYLNLDHNNLGDDGTWKLTQSLSSVLSLQELHLSNNSIGDSGLVEIGRCLPKLEHLHLLRLSDNQIKGMSIHGFVSGLRDSNLTELVLSNNQIQSEGAVSISKLLGAESYNALESLDLSHNQVCDDGATALAKSLQSHEHGGPLQRLYLQDNDIGDLGAGAFVEYFDATGKGCLSLNLHQNPKISESRTRILDMLLKHQHNHPLFPRLSAQPKSSPPGNDQEQRVNLLEQEVQQLKEEVATMKTKMESRELELNERIKAERTRAVQERMEMMNLIEILRKNIIASTNNPKQLILHVAPKKD